MESVLYDRWVFIEGVDHGVLMDNDGYGEGLNKAGVVVDEYVKPSDVDVLHKEIRYVRWFRYGKMAA